MKCTAAIALSLIATASASTRVHAQTLAVQGDHFTVDGHPRFLVLLSYFDALRRANGGDADPLAEDFTFFQGKVDGVRIMVNWWRCADNHCGGPDSEAADSLIDSSGLIRDKENWHGVGLDPWSRFVAVLDAARKHALIIDVTFTRESISLPPSLENYAKGIAAVISRLEREHAGQYRNLFFDVQNEYQDTNQLSLPQAQSLIATAHSARANAIVTASQDQAVGAVAAGANARVGAFDLAAFHDPRAPAWSDEPTIGAVITGVKTGLNGTVMPIVLDEPTRWDSDDTKSHFTDAARWAKKHGAALWVLHSASGYSLASSTWLASSRRDEQLALSAIRSAVDAQAWGARIRE